MTKKIVLNSRDFEYSLTRKKVKKINLRIKPDGTLHVSANRFVSIGTIEAFLVSNADRIIKAVDRFAEIAKKRPNEKVYENGERFSILGENKVLEIYRGKKNGAEIRGQNLSISVKDETDKELIKKVLEGFKKELCEKVVREICDAVFPIFEAKGIAYPKLKFRNMKTRWGSCQPKKRILTFNTKLVEYPRDAIEYVVMHEFAHFLHPDHSKSFYATLTSLMPDWKRRKEML